MPKIIDLLVEEYLATYAIFINKPDSDLCGFVDAHDAAYSALNEILAEAVYEAQEKIDTAKDDLK